MKGFLIRNQLLLVVFFVFFLTTFFGQTVTGHTQKGSAESKKPEDVGENPQDADPLEEVQPDSPWPVRHGKGLLLSLYSDSLSIAFLLLFAGAFVLHLVGGAREFSQEQQAHGGASVSPAGVEAGGDAHSSTGT